MYDLDLTDKFKSKYRKLVVRNQQLKEKTGLILQKLQENPFQKSLKTHKVYVSQFGEVFSSRLTGDLRLLWSMQKDICLILLLDIGGHSGNRRVY